MPWEALKEVVQRQGSPQAHGVKSFTGLCSWSFRGYLSRERLSLPALPSWKDWQLEPLSVCRNSKIGTFKLLLDKCDQSEEEKKMFPQHQQKVWMGWSQEKAPLTILQPSMCCLLLGKDLEGKKASSYCKDDLFSYRYWHKFHFVLG